MSYKAYQGDDGTWGVVDGGILYDPQFSKATAEAVADMENSKNPPKDWEETAERLDKMGLPH